MRCFFLPLLQAVAWLAGRLPQRWVLALGRGLAWGLWPALGSRRRIARINVDRHLQEIIRQHNERTDGFAVDPASAGDPAVEPVPAELALDELKIAEIPLPAETAKFELMLLLQVLQPELSVA